MRREEFEVLAVKAMTNETEDTVRTEWLLADHA
jgi:hypothetical protein